MKSIIGIYILFNFFMSNVSLIVTEFHVLDSKENELAFIKKYKETKNTSVLAYVYAVEMKQAEYAFNPISKLKIFNKTKKKLDKLILANPNNIDVRYIRLVLQEQTPSILGYKDNIKEDKEFLNNQIAQGNIEKYFLEYIYKNTSL